MTEVHWNDWAALTAPRLDLGGFREYDARWRFPEGIDPAGAGAVGLAFGTQLQESGRQPVVVVGHDYRSYSQSIKHALCLGLVEAGIRVLDIGLCLTPTAYFAQMHLGAAAVAMVTASHNPNGWTGVKMGFDAPLTHGPEEMARLREIVRSDSGKPRVGGGYSRVEGMREAYLDDLVGSFRMVRPLKVVCATGNGGAGAFAPELLARIGVEPVPLRTALDASFPHYNPNPEALEMLDDMAGEVRRAGADIALGFDGDGDRCGVVSDEGHPIFADKIGLALARDLVVHHPGARFVVDVKSTGLFATDPVLHAHRAEVEYWKTGHSHIKRRIRETGALAGFEKSGHVFFAPPLGRGYDCGLRAALEICKLMDRNPAVSLSGLMRALPQSWGSPTMSPACADDSKYAVVERITAFIRSMAARGQRFAGRTIAELITVNGVRIVLDNGSWALVRASSNSPNLVVVCESLTSSAERGILFDALDAIIRVQPEVGPYDQSI